MSAPPANIISGLLFNTYSFWPESAQSIELNTAQFSKILGRLKNTSGDGDSKHDVFGASPDRPYRCQ